MNKTLITTAIALSAISFAFAQEATTTCSGVDTSCATSTTTPPALPPPVVTGDAKADNQIRLLRKEMETKIKAIRAEYQTKLKAIVAANVAARKAAKGKSMTASSTNATSTKQKGKPISELDNQPEVLGTTTAQMRVLNNKGATTTKAEPKGNAWGFFRRFFGLSKPVTTTVTSTTTAQ